MLSLEQLENMLTPQPYEPQRPIADGRIARYRDFEAYLLPFLRRLLRASKTEKKMTMKEFIDSVIQLEGLDDKYDGHDDRDDGHGHGDDNTEFQDFNNSRENLILMVATMTAEFSRQQVSKNLHHSRKDKMYTRLRDEIWTIIIRYIRIHGRFTLRNLSVAFSHHIMSTVLIGT
jgi:hypothetical protein